ncbi:MAG: YeeE/YedE family protein [Deltaproteobacteria bacterium]|nr:YeeE/YedE family protein [Deltaproteobacteria bacterium]
MRGWLPVIVICGYLGVAAPVSAQCTSNASSCVTCHETQGLRPVLRSPQPWHSDHGFADLCAACHGGDAAAEGKARAHWGLRSPLADPARACAGCHSGDASARAERYLSHTPSAGATTPPTGAAPTAPRAATASADHHAAAASANRVLAGLALLLAVALAFALARRPAQRRPALARWLRQKLWSPYLAGALLGLVVAASEVVWGRPLGVAGAFDKLAAYPGRWLFPHSQYYRYVMAPAITWQVWLVIGLLGGAFASSAVSGEARARWLPDTQWQPRFAASRATRLMVAFVGAILVQFGAGIAGGCTSGLAISGGAALAPAAFLFMAGMFAGGIPTAWLLYRGRPR